MRLPQLRSGAVGFEVRLKVPCAAMQRLSAWLFSLCHSFCWQLYPACAGQAGSLSLSQAANALLLYTPGTVAVQTVRLLLHWLAPPRRRRRRRRRTRRVLQAPNPQRF